MINRFLRFSLLACAVAGSALEASAANTLSAASTSSTLAKPWLNKSLPTDERVALVLKEMTLDEKLTLVYGYFGADMPPKNYTRIPEALPLSAGYVHGIPRLGIPAQFETDAGLGVASQIGENPRGRTALPAGTATAASWNPELSYQGGAMVGSEARTSGFNVVLAGGVNLVREPRNGRNFEYAGEDPLLAGTIVGNAIRGVQSNNVISTLKHFAFNNQETNRFGLNAVIDEASARMSDLFALQIANEIGKPGAVMCAYNRVMGFYACESDFLLNQVLKGDWKFQGYVMSDWGATHSTVPAANSGLDQDSASEAFNQSKYFGAPLKEAVINGWVSQARLDNMAGRILWAMFDKGVVDNPVTPSEDIDFKAHAEVSQRTAEEGIVLLKNAKNILPLSKNTKKIAVIGRYADIGVLSGGGSSRVYPVGGLIVKGLQPELWPGPIVYLPSSPLKSIQAMAPQAEVVFNNGTDVASAKKVAAEADVVVYFAEQWIGEDNDAVNLVLPNKQDELIAALAKSNSKTIVVLETGTPVYMPWLDKVPAVLAAWYPGTRGAEAIANILFGDVNPSGRLPFTFPASDKQFVNPILPGNREDKHLRFDLVYKEGAAVGYKWFDVNKFKPLFPFGFGLSYTEFAFSNLRTEMRGDQVVAHFKVTNTGKVRGKAVPQIYVSPTKTQWEAPKRLAGWSKLELNPGETADVSVPLEGRVLSMYQTAQKNWLITDDEYTIILAQHARDEKPVTVKVRLAERRLAMNGANLR